VYSFVHVLEPNVTKNGEQGLPYADFRQVKDFMFASLGGEKGGGRGRKRSGVVLRSLFFAPNLL